MENLSKNQKQEIVDFFGKTVIEDVRDDSLKFSMGIVNQATNPVKREQYKVFETLTNEQKEAVCDLLSETITNSIYYFLEMFEEHENEMELLIKKNEKKYDMVKISEKMGSEIACYGDEGWIQKFSKIGRFVL